MAKFPAGCLGSFGQGLDEAAVVVDDGQPDHPTESRDATGEFGKAFTGFSLPSATLARVNALEAIVLGLVQGLTEFLPISSSGHLRIVPAVFGWEDPGAGFTAVIQLGTMAAVLLYFRADIWRITRTWFRELGRPRSELSADAKLGWIIAFGTVPISILGFAFSDQIESSARDLYVIGTALILFSFVMLAAEHYAKNRPEKRDIENATVKDGVGIGFAQALALIPGISRSGATISAGLFAGFDRTAAARFSFLLSIPAVVLSGLFELKEIGGEDGASVGATIIATIAAFISGYAAIAWLLRYLATHTLTIFVIYRSPLGIAVIALTATGAIA